jgi:hypothetical protein
MFIQYYQTPKKLVAEYVIRPQPTKSYFLKNVDCEAFLESAPGIDGNQTAGDAFQYRRY